MDAVKFIKERNRMCKFYFDAARVCCSNNCPAYHLDCNCCALGHLDEDNESLVEVVEKWSKENPIKTMQDVFLEQHPETKLNMNGVLDLCPAISAAYEYGSVHCKNTDRSCGFCRREFWMREVN